MGYIAGFDIETTGLEAEEHRIVELGLCLYNHDGTPKARIEQRFNPRRSITPKAQEVHGIDISELLDKPLFGDWAPKLLPVLAKCDLLVAHNGEDFDMPFLAQELLRNGLSIPSVQTFDTMKQGRWATASGKYPSLKELCFACDVVYDEAQALGAIYDIEVMMACFFKGWKWGFFKPDLASLSGAVNA